MRTILLFIEYDGTAYSGWQVQLNSLTIQEVVEKALFEVIGEHVRLSAAGRTDAGVHAVALPAHFRTNSELPLTAFREGVNRLLPNDIAIKEAKIMPSGFHARYSARGKWYRYTLHIGKVRSPLAARTSWHIHSSPDLLIMRTAAQNIIGCHDFQAFRTSGCAAETTVREIFSLEIERLNDFVYLDVRGTGFLKNMVRMMVGTLVEIGSGKRPVDDIKRLLTNEENVKCGPTAPAHGLCLMEVFYNL